MPTQLAGVLRRARQAHALSQAELAAKAGLSESMVTQIERAKRLPSSDTLAALAEALGASKKERAELEAARLADRGQGRPGVPVVEADGRSIGGLSDAEYEALTGVLRAMRGGR